jgi:L-ascorbate metabolism protein UlaG (beta-lactamase superfamily)
MANKDITSRNTREKRSEVKGRRENAYVLTLEGMSVAVLGVAATTEMPGETREMLSNPDILIVPVNAEGGLTPKDAAKMALSLEPLIIIPVLYGEKENAEALKTFIKEVGEENPVVTDKLTLKRKDLEGKDATVIIITPEVK